MNRLGIDLGGTTIEGVVLSDDGRVLSKRRISINYLVFLIKAM